ncbi:MAG: hypothetical protein ACE5J7_03380 [Candidatus Aenigmatarchaeota archaeon]
MRITITDVLIVLLIVVFVYFSLTAPRYFQVKGNELFGAVMTYKTLVGRGYGADAEISGIGSGFDLQSIEGIVIDATSTRMYIWDSNRVHVVFQKDEKNPLAHGSEPQSPYITSSIITLRPTQSYSLEETGCEGAEFVSQTLYIELDKETDSIVCDYISKKLWDRFGGEIGCRADGNHARINLAFAHDFSFGEIENTFSDFRYKVESYQTLSTKCLVLK